MVRTRIDTRSAVSGASDGGWKCRALPHSQVNGHEFRSTARFPTATANHAWISGCEES